MMGGGGSVSLLRHNPEIYLKVVNKTTVTFVTLVLRCSDIRHPDPHTRGQSEISRLWVSVYPKYEYMNVFLVFMHYDKKSVGRDPHILHLFIIRFRWQVHTRADLLSSRERDSGCPTTDRSATILGSVSSNRLKLLPHAIFCVFLPLVHLVLLTWEYSYRFVEALVTIFDTVRCDRFSWSIAFYGETWQLEASGPVTRKNMNKLLNWLWYELRWIWRLR